MRQFRRRRNLWWKCDTKEGGLYISVGTSACQIPPTFCPLQSQKISPHKAARAFIPTCRLMTTAKGYWYLLWLASDDSLRPSTACRDPVLFCRGVSVMTSWNGNAFRIIGLCGFPYKSPLVSPQEGQPVWSSDIFLILSSKELFSKHSCRRILRCHDAHMIALKRISVS